MEKQETVQLNKLLRTNDESLRKLHAIVEATMQEENLIVQNLMNPPAEILTKGQRISDKVARFGGSWAFIISFGIILFAWVLLNTVSPKADVFDPYPFILMNLILSCIAALQAPIIMMSQNRKEEKDRQRAENDYLVNLKAELEIRNLHRKIDLLMEEQISRLVEVQDAQMALLEKLNARVKS
ncbi:MAG: DUF1003 domain-containing protein [Lewinellaceae bacterium]|nr:DUF1003 domain-containing protein [Lewinellaceae bacterium]